MAGRQDLESRMNYDPPTTGLGKLAEILEAMGYGAGSETSFGASDKLTGRRGAILANARPTATAVGRVGSYLIPLPIPSKIKALAKVPAGVKKLRAMAQAAPHLAPIIEHAIETVGKQGFAAGQHLLGNAAEAVASKVAAPVEGLLGKTAASATKGALSAVGAGEGNHLIRKAIGTADDVGSPSSTTDRMQTEALFGGGTGVLGQILQKVAPSIYQHNALMSPYKEENSEKLADELMNEGTWGTLKTFKNRAQQFKDEAAPMFDTVKQSVAGGEHGQARRLAAMIDQFFGLPPGTTPVPKGLIEPKAFMGRRLREEDNAWKLATAKRSERKTLQEAYQDALSGLRRDKFGATDVEALDKGVHETNKRFAKLKAVEQAKLSGAQGLGESSADLDTAKHVHDTFETMYKRALRDYGAPGDDALYDLAKVTHAKGADLEKNLFAHNLLNANSKPRLFSDALRNVADSSINSAPVRTGLGVLANKSAPEVLGSRAGRMVEMRDRPKPAVPPLEGSESGAEEDFSQDIPPAAPLGPDNPDTQESGAKFGYDQNVLKAIHDPEHMTPEVEAAANKRLNEIRDSAKKGKKPQVNEEDPENPFLQDIPE